MPVDCPANAEMGVSLPVEVNKGYEFTTDTSGYFDGIEGTDLAAHALMLGPAPRPRPTCPHCCPHHYPAAPDANEAGAAVEHGTKAQALICRFDLPFIIRNNRLLQHEPAVAAVAFRAVVSFVILTIRYPGRATKGLSPRSEIVRLASL